MQLVGPIRYIFWFCSTIHSAQINKENIKHLSITSSSRIQGPHLASSLASSGLQAGMEMVWKVEELKVDEVGLVPQSPHWYRCWGRTPPCWNPRGERWRCSLNPPTAASADQVLLELSSLFCVFCVYQLRILPQQNTALLSHFRVSVRRRDMSIYANIYIQILSIDSNIYHVLMTRPDQTTTAMTTTMMTTWWPLQDHLATTWRPLGSQVAVWMAQNPHSLLRLVQGKGRYQKKRDYVGKIPKLGWWVWPKPTSWCLLTKLFLACQNDSEVLKHVLQKGGRWYLINFNT